ncbi:MAG: transketolase [Prevotella sp.]|nr:transketolase [Paraprevotella sp.]MCI6201631.1 transketolase [Paraprevotella sp.]MDD7691677.1 transketolase [Prevotella sp.]
MDNKITFPELRLRSEEIRKRLIEIVYKAKAGHIGGDLSSLNTLTALYLRVMNIDPQDAKNPDRDRFIMSKGHCVEALYCVLEAKGFVTKELLDTYGDYLSPLAGHPTIEVPGIEFNSGALGHGLSIGVGCAIAAKMDKKSYRTFVLMGDGEQGEGSIYEAAMAGSNYRLDNLVAMIDRNGLQISDTTENVMKLDSINQRWTAFGWDVIEVDGDDIEAVTTALENIDYNNGKPHLVVLHTTKGFHVSYMENVLKWHHGVPSQEEYDTAIKEISQRIEELKAKI